MDATIKGRGVTAELVLDQLRGHNFAVLSTVGDDGAPHSAGVTYGLSRPGRDVALYVMTRRHLQKARDIAQNPTVSLVVPVPRRILWFLPPPTIQLRGRADILDWTDEVGADVFRGFWMGRRILEAYRTSYRRGESRICVLKITPHPVVRTYMVGSTIWELRTRMESGAGKVVLPPNGAVVLDLASEDGDASVTPGDLRPARREAAGVRLPRAPAWRE